MISELLMATMPLAGAVPVITGAIVPATGSTDGGTSIVIPVLSSVGCTGAAVGGVALTGFAIVDPTHVSGTTGAHAAGAADVTVTNANGTSAPLVGGFTYVATFDAATLVPDAWWRPDFALPWTPTAPSAHGNLIAGPGGGPAAGAALNGKIPSNWVGTSKALLTAQASSNFVTAGALTLIAFFRWSTPLYPDQVAWYSEPMIVGGDGGDFGMSISVSGVRSGNGGATNTPYVPLATGVWAMVALRVVLGGVSVRVSQPSGTVDSAPVTMAVGIDSFLKIGRNWNDTVFFTGDIAEILGWKRALSNSDLDNMRTYFNGQFAQGLT